MTESKHIEDIKEKLGKLNPYLVLLFGSYANGNPHKDSDLDIFVVLNEHTLPTTFKEKQELYLKVSPCLRTITEQIPVDLLVFTIPMYEKFKSIKSNVSKEVLNNGIVLYESNNTRMA